MKIFNDKFCIFVTLFVSAILITACQNNSENVSESGQSASVGTPIKKTPPPILSMQEAATKMGLTVNDIELVEPTYPEALYDGFPIPTGYKGKLQYSSLAEMEARK